MVVASCDENPVCKVGENLFRAQWVVGRKGGVFSMHKTTSWLEHCPDMLTWRVRSLVRAHTMNA